MMCGNIYYKNNLLQENGILKIKAFIAFSIDKGNVYV